MTDQAAPDQLMFFDPTETEPTPTDTRPMIDRTSCHGSLKSGSYYVGVPVGAGYALGRKYLAIHTRDGWNITRFGAPTVAAHPEDVALLRSYLEGPRQVRLALIRHGGTAFHDAHILERPYKIPNSPDVNDSTAWRAWISAEARKVLAEHYGGRVPAGSYYAIAVDTQAGYLQGWQGLWPLGGRGVDISLSS